MVLNNKRTGKDALKPRTLELLGHSDVHIFNITHLPYGENKKIPYFKVFN